MHAVDILTGGLASEYSSMSASESGSTAWKHLYGDVKVRSAVRQEKDDQWLVKDTDWGMQLYLEGSDI